MLSAAALDRQRSGTRPDYVPFRRNTNPPSSDFFKEESGDVRARTQNPPKKSVACSEPDATRPTCGRCREPFPPQLCSSLVPETVALHPRCSQLLICRQGTLPLCSPKLKPHRFSPRHSGGVSVPVLTRSYLFHRFCLINKRREPSARGGWGLVGQEKATHSRTVPPNPPPHRHEVLTYPGVNHFQGDVLGRRAGHWKGRKARGNGKNRR